jgi:hypothetical protein
MYVPMLLILFTVAISIGYAISYPHGSFPDEFNHVGYIYDVISNNFPDYKYGKDVSSGKLNYLDHPALYYFLTGEIIKIFSLEKYYIDSSRYINLFLSLGIVLVVIKTLRLVTKSEFVIFISCALLIIIPMFSVLSVAVNNDIINILGCAISVYGFVSITRPSVDQSSSDWAIKSICIGSILAALSKATGSLAILCMFLSITLFHFSMVKRIVKGISFKQWGVILFSVLIVAIYYVFIYKTYGSFFPAPQSNPATWYAVDHPDATRFDFYNFIMYFYNANIRSLTTPYGHVFFDDINIRVLLLKVVLINLCIMSIVVGMNFFSKKSEKNNVIFSLVCSFILYIIIYYCTIRSLHLKTGYLGAMQARYFFGFLPVFCLIMCKGFSYIKSYFVRAVIALAILFSLVLSFYPAYVNILNEKRLKSIYFIEQPFKSVAYSMLLKGHSFEQTIIAKTNSIMGCELFLSTFGRTPQGALVLFLLDDSGKVITTTSIQMGSIQDNSYAWFDLSSTKLIKDDKYKLRLICDECITVENSVTWLASDIIDENILFSSTNKGPGMLGGYLYGSAFVDDVKKDGDFTFKIYFN